ncbi:protein enabled-like [Arctopsyche grandis]|uniref:protein enabled-like n=1 Tax=Arctopsyche grandis TaxID=121162 RepID=UPI00406D82A4
MYSSMNNIDSGPNLGDLEAMLANFQQQIQREIESVSVEDQVILKTISNVDQNASMRSRINSVQDFANPKNAISSADKATSLMNLSNTEPNLPRYGSGNLNPHDGSKMDVSRSNILSKHNMIRGDATLPRSFNQTWKEEMQKQTNQANSNENVSQDKFDARTQRKSVGDTPEARWKEYWANEQSISSARASVMVYDDSLKKWIPSGTSSGLSKVHIYHHTQHNTFRVVGRKLHDHEVVINCGIVRGLKYNQATATFHQWRDSRQVYGLNFSCREDADCFARAMMHSLEVLASRGNGVGVPQPPPPAAVVNGHPPQPPIMPHYDEDMGTMTREDAAIIQQQHHQQHNQIHNQIQQQNQMQQQNQLQQQQQQNQIHSQNQLHIQLQQQQQNQLQSQLHSQLQQQQQQNQMHQNVQQAPQPPPHASQTLNHSLPLQQQQQHNTHTHHRTSSAPMAAAMSLPPAPPPVPPHQNLPCHSTAPVPPPTPPAAPPQPIHCGAPPPPPPPGGTGGPPPPPQPPPAPAPPDPGSLAAQLQHARLKKQNKQTTPQENSGSSTSSGGSVGGGTKATTPTPAPPTPMHSMMNEMARTLARRRAQVDRNEEIGTEPLKSWEKSATLPHRLGAAAGNGTGTTPPPPPAAPSNNGTPSSNEGHSPKSARRRFGSASEETILKVNGAGDGLCVGPGEWESFKQEVLKEVRTQVLSMKQDIIDAIKMELARR